ncbi:MAG TPA: DUF4136 domain-containing protein [Pyrinomonadaceae bacterium]|jgi:hypothetical protein
MKFRLALLGFLILMTVTTALAQDVTVDFDKRIDFSKFKTYTWASGVSARNPLIDQQIRNSMEGQLAAKGLRRVELGGDLSVLYIAAVEKDIEVSTGRWKETGDWMRQTVSGMRVGSQMWDVEVGTLVVCLSDSTGKNLLWRGAARTMLDKRSNKQNAIEAVREDARRIEKKVRKSLEKMFKQYPR